MNRLVLGVVIVVGLLVIIYYATRKSIRSVNLGNLLRPAATNQLASPPVSPLPSEVVFPSASSILPESGVLPATGL